MSNTILITGVTSGIGKATADYFRAKNWLVLGTSRSASQDPTIYPLDVTNPTDCARVIQQIVAEHGTIDVVVNNAGYGLFGAFEQCSEADVQAQYAVNVFGTMNVCRAILPQLRAQGNGTIVNISSMGGKFIVPYYGVYNSTKFAVEGFSEGLWHEVRPFGIKVKLIEPGVINTGFYDRSKQEGKQMDVDKKYKMTSDKLWQQYERVGKTGANSSVVAKVIYKAATSRSTRLRYAVGRDARINITLLKLLPHQVGLWLARLYTRS